LRLVGWQERKKRAGRRCRISSSLPTGPARYKALERLTDLDDNDDMKTVEHLFEETGLEIETVAERSGLTVERVAAIAEGRWTPSPQEREQIAAAFGMPVSEVSWGHSMNPRNIRYRRHGLKENF
jgi:ribosome-binding protein aMBF1 (putative translation factor)